MKLVFDENLSPRLVRLLAHDFAGSAHVEDLGLRGRSDLDVRKAAAAHGLTLVTKDSDFLELSLLYGPPPKVVWLRIGNVGTDAVAALLRRSRPRIEAFAGNEREALLELSFADG